MIQVTNFMKNLFDKYNSLRQEAWTHWLVLVTYLFAIETIHEYIKLSIKGSIETFVLYLIYATTIYLGLSSFALVMGFYNQFQKSKIKNKFLTQNKLYWIYWTVGNILFLWFIGFYIKHYLN